MRTRTINVRLSAEASEALTALQTRPGMEALSQNALINLVLVQSVSPLPKTVRLSLDVSEGMKRDIEALTTELCCTQAELLRRGVALMQTLREGISRGESAALVKGDAIVARFVNV